MKKLKVGSEEQKVADLTIFCDEKESQQYLVYDLRYGENVIGRNSSKCSIVFRFTPEIDDVQAKITIEDDDYTIEDLGSTRGTFKIKADNSLIRLKPFKSYDLSSNQAFYIGKFRCVFRVVRPGRGNIAQTPSPLSNSQRLANAQRKPLRKQPSLEDDIEDTTYSKANMPQKNQITGFVKMVQPHIDSELIEEDEEQGFVQTGRMDRKIGLSLALGRNKGLSQKNFVKSKGQISKDKQNELVGNQKRGSIGERFKIEDDDEWNTQPRNQSLLTQLEEKEQNIKRRTCIRKTPSQVIREVVLDEKEEEEQEQFKLNSQFLKRIQEKLKSNQQNAQKELIHEMALKYSSQKRVSQDIPFEDKKLSNPIKQDVTLNDDQEHLWQPSDVRRIRNGETVANKKTKLRSIPAKQNNSDIIKTIGSTTILKETKTKQNALILDKISENGKCPQKTRQTQIESLAAPSTAQQEVVVPIKKTKNITAVAQLSKRKTKDAALKPNISNGVKIGTRAKCKSEGQTMELSNGISGKKESKNQMKLEQKLGKTIELVQANQQKSLIVDEEVKEEKQIQSETKITRRKTIEVKVEEEEQKQPSQIKGAEIGGVGERRGRKKKSNINEEPSKNEMPSKKLKKSNLSNENPQTNLRNSNGVAHISGTVQRSTESEPAKRTRKRETISLDETVLPQENEALKRNEKGKKSIQKEAIKVDGLAEKGRQRIGKQVIAVENSKLIRKTKTSKKELANLTAGNESSILEMPRRHQYRVMFSNSSATDEEKKQMIRLGVKIVNEFSNVNDFNILITDEMKRRLKTLVALNKGYPIISREWIQECLLQEKVVPFAPFLLTKVDKIFAKSHKFDMKKVLENQKSHLPLGIFHNIQFLTHTSFENLDKEQLRQLIESAGGILLEDALLSQNIYFLSDPSRVQQNNALHAMNCAVLDIEGVLQSCLLQQNLLDNYLIKPHKINPKK